jgi:hypothetical protein
MHTAIIAPRKYIQGRGSLSELGAQVKDLGSRPLLITDEVVGQLYGTTSRWAAPPSRRGWPRVDPRRSAARAPRAHRAPPRASALDHYAHSGQLRRR